MQMWRLEIYKLLNMIKEIARYIAGKDFGEQFQCQFFFGETRETV